MAVSVEATIMDALVARLAAFMATPVLPIAWPNRLFVEPIDRKYLRFAFIPAVTKRITINPTGQHQYLGLAQVSVCWPLLVGEDAPLEVAGAIAAWFPSDLLLTNGAIKVRVTKRPNVAALIQGDTGIMIPVTIAYEAFA